ncbi:radical SAM protein [Candidatus Omnitrophota bacterium]
MATISQKLKLLKGLTNGEAACTGPFYATIDLTRRCNLQCIGCRYHSTQVRIPSAGDQSVLDIPFDLIKKVFAELKEMGTHSLILIGEGEPLLHPQMIDIVRLAKQSNFHTSMLTNGTLLNEANIRSLIDAGLDILKVSLWAASCEEYEKNYPGNNPNNFKKILDGLRLLAELKRKQKSKLPCINLHQPLNLYNFQNIERMVMLARETGCDMLTFSPFKARRGSLASSALSLEQERSLCACLRLMKKKLGSLSMLHNIGETLLRYRIGEAVWEKLPCYIGWLHARIKVDGTVYPCNPCDQPLGNIREKSLPEIWNNADWRRFRRQTITRSGLEQMAKQCDCGFCCLLRDNLRVHRMFRWVAPFARVIRKKNHAD